MSESTRPMPTAEDAEKGKVMAILGYLCCFLIPLLAAKDNRFCMFHAEQALVLFLLWVIGGVLSLVLVGYIIELFALVLMIIGIINAAQGKSVPLPVVGQFGEKFNLMK
jgi:uncharacterized membrane protein